MLSLSLVQLSPNLLVLLMVNLKMVTQSGVQKIGSSGTASTGQTIHPDRTHGFPLYGPKPFHPLIISPKLSVYRNPLLDVQSFSCIQLYTAVYSYIQLYIVYCMFGSYIVIIQTKVKSKKMFFPISIH